MLRFINLQPLGARWSTLILLGISLFIYFFVSLRDLAHLFIKRPADIHSINYYEMKKSDPNVKTQKT